MSNNAYAGTHNSFPCSSITMEEQGEWEWVLMPKNTRTTAPLTTTSHPYYPDTQLPFASQGLHSSIPEYTVPPTYLHQTMPDGSSLMGTEPMAWTGLDISLLDGIEPSLTFGLPSCLDAPQTFPEPQSMPSSSPVDFSMDADMDAFLASLDNHPPLDTNMLFSPLTDFGPYTPESSVDLSSALFSSPPSTGSLASPTAPQQQGWPATTTVPPLTPASSSTPATSSSAANTPETPDDTPTLHPCPYQGCSQVFNKRAELKKHERKHRLPFKCAVAGCGKGYIDQRALARHLWAQHPQFASKTETRSERKRCPYPSCDYEGRHDNVARHARKKHPSFSVSGR